MNMITNNLPTAELQKLDAAHHIHPFTDADGLEAKGARVITRGEGVWLTDSEGHRIIDGMAGLWCVNIGYGRKELAGPPPSRWKSWPITTPSSRPPMCRPSPWPPSWPKSRRAI
ncbi:hypothetical protein MASR1M32_21870 [Rhodobacter sp.]